jgi:hypothetical protein
MPTTSRVLLLTLVAMLMLAVFTATTARAEFDDEDDDGVPTSTQGSDVPEDPKVDMAVGDDDDEPENMPEEEDEDEDDAMSQSPVVGKAVFLGAAEGEQLAAGEWVDTILAFDNIDESAGYIVRFVASHLNQIGDQTAYVQNFTGNTYERTVEAKSTGTFKYRFKPHESLDPRDYNLVIRMFFSTPNNETLAVAAFNGTVTVTEPLGTDPEMIMTFVTIAALLGAAVWWFSGKKASAPARRPASATTSTQEMGTKASLNNDYVSADHMRFQQALNDRKTSSSPKSRKNK